MQDRSLYSNCDHPHPEWCGDVGRGVGVGILNWTTGWHQRLIVGRGNKQGEGNGDL